MQQSRRKQDSTCFCIGRYFLEFNYYLPSGSFFMSVDTTYNGCEIYKQHKGEKGYVFHPSGDVIGLPLPEGKKPRTLQRAAGYINSIPTECGRHACELYDACHPQIGAMTDVHQKHQPAIFRGQPTVNTSLNNQFLTINPGGQIKIKGLN